MASGKAPPSMYGGTGATDLAASSVYDFEPEVPSSRRLDRISLPIDVRDPDLPCSESAVPRAA